MKISELMSRPVYTCRTTDTLDRAAALMWEHDIGTVAVVNDTDELVGMVTDRDACMASYTRGRALRDIPVDVAMSNHVVACVAEDSDAAVAQMMAKHKLRRIPVIDEARRPIGMVSLNDLARTMARGRDVPASSVAGTLAAISEHRQPDRGNSKRAAT